MIVLEHISTLLCSSEAEARRNANEFLVKWQQSVEAWQEAHAIIAGGYPPEAKLIAAQTLRTKLMYDFYQLPPDSVEKLCEILMSYLAEPTLPRNISSTLCLAVCDLAIQAAESWPSPLDYFIACYGRGALALKTLLALIEGLAEEAANTRIIVTPDIRNKVTQNMKSDYGKLLGLLVKLRASVNDMEVSSAIFRCWHSWRRLDNFAGNAEACKIFINDCLQIVRRANSRVEHGIDDSTYEAAVDCMGDVLYEVADLTHRIRKEAEASSDAVEYLKQTKSDLQQVVGACFDLCVSDEFNDFLVEAFHSNDRFLLGCFCNLVIALIDALDFSLIEPQPQLSRLLMLAVRFVELPYCLVFSGFSTADEPSTVNCFSKYYNRMAVRDAVLQAVAACNPADFSAIEEETTVYAQRSVALILSVLHAESPNCQGAQEICDQLVEIVLLVATRPAFTSEADNNEYESYVAEVYEALPQLAKVLRSDRLFETVKKFTIDRGSFAASHQGLDACFRALGATVAALDVRRTSRQNVAAIFSVIEGVKNLLRGNIPTGLVELYCWESAIQFLRDAKRVLLLDETEVIVQLVMGLLCDVYMALLGSSTPHASKIESTLVASISSVCYYVHLGRLREWQPVLQSLGLCIQRAGQNHSFAVMLIEGTAHAISDLPPDTIRTIVQEMTQVWFQQLEAVVRGEVAMTAVEVSKLVTKVCALVRNVKMKDIFHKIVLEGIAPLMCRLLEKYREEPIAVEEICRCLKHSARSVGPGFAAATHEVVVTVGGVAKERLFSTYLYAVEWLYTLFSPGQPELAEVKQLYFMLTETTLNVLADKDARAQLREDPEQLVEDFFGLQTRFIKNAPECFDNEAALRDIVAASVMCFNMRQPQCVFEFWIALLESDAAVPRLLAVVTEYLPKCVEEVFGVLAGGCRTAVEHCVEDFVDAVVRALGGDAARLLQLGLQKLPLAVVPNERQRGIMLQALLSERRQAAVYELHKLCCQVAMRKRT